MSRVKASESAISVKKCIYPNGNTYFDVIFSSDGIVKEQYSFKLHEDGTTLTTANGGSETTDVSGRAANAIRYSMENGLFN